MSTSLTTTLIAIHPDAIYPTSATRIGGQAEIERMLFLGLAADGTLDLPAPGWRNVRLAALARISAVAGNRVILLSSRTSPYADDLSWVHPTIGNLRGAITGEVRPSEEGGDTVEARIWALQWMLARSEVFDGVPAEERHVVVVDPMLGDETAGDGSARGYLVEAVMQSTERPLAGRLTMICPSPWGLLGSDLDRLVEAAGCSLSAGEPVECEEPQDF